MNQRVHGRRLERVAAHQQRVEREHLAQALVVNEAGHSVVNAAPSTQPQNLRRGFGHVAPRQERHGSQLQITVLHGVAREGQKAPVAFHIARRAQRNLALQLGLVVHIVEGVAVFPTQAIQRGDGQQLNMVCHALSGQSEQLFQCVGVGDDGGACVKSEAVLLVNVGAATRLVALFEHRGLNAAGLQTDGQCQAAKACADDGGCFAAVLQARAAIALVVVVVFVNINAVALHAATSCMRGANSAFMAVLSGTGGLPLTMRSLSSIDKRSP